MTQENQNQADYGYFGRVGQRFLANRCTSEISGFHAAVEFFVFRNQINVDNNH